MTFVGRFSLSPALACRLTLRPMSTQKTKVEQLQRKLQGQLAQLVRNGVPDVCRAVGNELFSSFNGVHG